MHRTQFGTLKTTHCLTFFTPSTANLSQQASTFALRAMGDVYSGFRHDRDGAGPCGKNTNSTRQSGP